MMRCVLPQGLWSLTPPSHRISCLSILNNPPSVWSGAHDGSIILWRLEDELDDRGASGDLKEEGVSEVCWPASLLFGHSSPVISITPCNSEHGTLSSFPPHDSLPPSENVALSLLPQHSSSIMTEKSNDAPKQLTPVASKYEFPNIVTLDSMLSVCSQGTLCLWDGSSGKCKKRRCLPSWVGKPSCTSTLPSSTRYICIACNGDSVNLDFHSEKRNSDRVGSSDNAAEKSKSKPSDPLSRGSNEQSQNAVGAIDMETDHDVDFEDGEYSTKGRNRRRSRGTNHLSCISKSTVLIIDASTFEILHVVHQGVMDISPIQHIVAIQNVYQPSSIRSSLLVCAVDAYGQTKIWNDVHPFPNSAMIDSGKRKSFSETGGKGAFSSNEESCSWEASTHSSWHAAVTRSTCISPDSSMILTVFPSHWFLRSASNGRLLALGAYADSMAQLNADAPSDIEWLGGIFLVNSESHAEKNHGIQGMRKAHSVLVWDQLGQAYIFGLPSTLTNRFSDFEFSEGGFPIVLPCIDQIPKENFAESKSNFFFIQAGTDLILRIVDSSSSVDGIGSFPAMSVWKFQSPGTHDKFFTETGNSVEDSMPLIKFNHTLLTPPDKLLDITLINTRAAVTPRIGFTSLHHTWMTQVNLMVSASSFYAGLTRPIPPSDHLFNPLDSDPTVLFRRLAMESSVFNPYTFITASLFVSSNPLRSSLLARGLVCGKIELIPMFTSSSASNFEPLVELHGHEGPVLCLAEYKPTNSQSRANNTGIFISILISGGMDWTVRLWDLTSGKGEMTEKKTEGKRNSEEIDTIGTPLAIFHHHNAPVRRILLPPESAYSAWKYCFISSADDGSIALTSLETLQCERIFTGHRYPPDVILWDTTASFLFCLFEARESNPRENDGEESCSYARFMSNELSTIQSGENSRSTTQAEIRRFSKEHPEEEESESFSEGDSQISRSEDSLNEEDELRETNKKNSEKREVKRRKYHITDHFSQVRIYVYDVHTGALDRVVKGIKCYEFFLHSASSNHSISKTNAKYRAVNLSPIHLLLSSDSSPDRKLTGSWKGNTELEVNPSEPSTSYDKEASNFSATIQSAPESNVETPETFLTSFGHEMNLSKSSSLGSSVLDEKKIFIHESNEQSFKKLVNTEEKIENPAENSTLELVSSLSVSFPSDSNSSSTPSISAPKLYSSACTSSAPISSQYSPTPSTIKRFKSFKQNYHRYQSVNGFSPYSYLSVIHYNISFLLSDSNAEKSLSSNHSSLLSMNLLTFLQIPENIQLFFDMESSDVEVMTSARLNVEEVKAALGLMHEWGVDSNLDKEIVQKLGVSLPRNSISAQSVSGDKGSLTLFFPFKKSKLLFWKISPELSTLRSLALLGICHCLSASYGFKSATCHSLVEFYVFRIWKLIPGIVPPSLEVMACYFSDKNKVLRLAARLLFDSMAHKSTPSILRKTSDFTSSPESIQGNLSFNSNSNYVDDSGKYKPQLIFEKPVPLSNWGGLDHSVIATWLESLPNVSENLLPWIKSPHEMRSVRVIISSILAIRHKDLARADLASSVAPSLLALVRSPQDRFTACASEILAEGMLSTWRDIIRLQIPRLILDVFLLCDALCQQTSTTNQTTSENDKTTSGNLWEGLGLGLTSNPSVGITSYDSVYSFPSNGQKKSTTTKSTESKPGLPAGRERIRENLICLLLPQLAMTNLQAFLTAVRSQITSAPATSNIHFIAMYVIIQVLRMDPKVLSTKLSEVVATLLLFLDSSNSSLKKSCQTCALEVLRQLTNFLPMIAVRWNPLFPHSLLHAKLAVGDSMGPFNNLMIHVYDVQSASKIRVLDASGPPGILKASSSSPSSSTPSSPSPSTFSPSLSKSGLRDDVSSTNQNGISALTFSSDGETLVAFSRQILVIRWWSLTSQWWERLSRNSPPVHCSKMVFVPPLPSIVSPSLHAHLHHHPHLSFEDIALLSLHKEAESKKANSSILDSIDLNYEVQWKNDRRVALIYSEEELLSFQ